MTVRGDATRRDAAWAGSARSGANAWGDFAGQSVVVTGAASGIGRAVADLLEREGATVSRWDIGDGDRDVGDGRGGSGGGRAGAARRVDVRDADAVERAAAEHGAAPDGLVHAAGIHRVGGVIAGDHSEFPALLTTNLVGTANVLAAFGRRMSERGTGAIVTIASDAAVVPRPSMGLYAASKAGALQLALSAALELAPAGVRCNVVCPGATDTPMQRARWGETAGAGDGGAEPGTPPPWVIGGDAATFRGALPLGRIADPDDIAELVAFLLSDRAAHVTAQRLLIDGGASLGR